MALSKDKRYIHPKLKYLKAVLMDDLELTEEDIDKVWAEVQSKIEQNGV